MLIAAFDLTLIAAVDSTVIAALDLTVITPCASMLVTAVDLTFSSPALHSIVMPPGPSEILFWLTSTTAWPGLLSSVTFPPLFVASVTLPL